MEDTRKTHTGLVSDLMLDIGFVLVPQDRYEELIRAETERDVLEMTVSGGTSYATEKVLVAIRSARSKVHRAETPELGAETEDKPDAE